MKPSLNDLTNHLNKMIEKGEQLFLVSQCNGDHGMIDLFQVERFFLCEDQLMAKPQVNAFPNTHSDINFAAFCVEPEKIVTLKYVVNDT